MKRKKLLKRKIEEREKVIGSEKKKKGEKKNVCLQLRKDLRHFFTLNFSCCGSGFL